MRTVTRDMPSSREMARRDSPFSRPCWIAFHRASWVGVGVRVHGLDAVLAVSFAAASLAGDRFESRLGRTHRLQGGQTTLLGLADVVIPHAADDALELRARGPGGYSGPQGAHARRRFLGGYATASYLTMSSPSGRSSTLTRSPA